MTLALADQAEAWAVAYVADAAGLPVYASTIAALGTNPLDARTTWDRITEWHPWAKGYTGHAIGAVARRGW
jgi:hypothetical protein